MEIKLAGKTEIQGVLDLQSLYLYDNLPEEGRKNGFVTTPFTAAQIEAIISDKGLFIAVDHQRVVAYVFAGSWKYYEQWPIFPYMTSFFPRLTFKNGPLTTENSFQYGPVCVDVAYRGTGLLNSLVETMRAHMLQRYPIAATFINKLNQRSLNAHVNKLGWEVIGEFEYNSKNYDILAFDMSRSVVRSSGEGNVANGAGVR